MGDIFHEAKLVETCASAKSLSISDIELGYLRDSGCATLMSGIVTMLFSFPLPSRVSHGLHISIA